MKEILKAVQEMNRIREEAELKIDVSKLLEEDKEDEEDSKRHNK